MRETVGQSPPLKHESQAVTRVAHMVDGNATNQRPTYYDLIKLTVKKEAEIHFDEAKKTRDSTLRPKATTHFHFNSKKSMFLQFGW